LFIACSSGARVGGSVPDEPPAKAQAQPGKTAGQYLALTDNRYGAYRAAPDTPELGELAPDIELPDAAGSKFSLAAHEGPVLVMFYRGFW
jgi:hypothetical protein